MFFANLRHSLFFLLQGLSHSFLAKSHSFITVVLVDDARVVYRCFPTFLAVAFSELQPKMLHLAFRSPKREPPTHCSTVVLREGAFLVDLKVTCLEILPRRSPPVTAQEDFYLVVLSNPRVVQLYLHRMLVNNNRLQLLYLMLHPRQQAVCFLKVGACLLLSETQLTTFFYKVIVIFSSTTAVLITTGSSFLVLC